MIQVDDDDKEEESEFLSARMSDIGIRFEAESSGGASLDRETSTTSSKADEGGSLPVLLKPNCTLFLTQESLNV